MTSWLDAVMPHLVAAPIVLPLAAAAVILVLGQRWRAASALVDVAASVAGLAVAVALLVWVDRGGEGGAIAVYLPANWPVPYGIALVVDRLAALMLVLANLLGVTAVLYATARWHRAGVHFHPLFQLQLMGLNGAFLTADLFTLFVFVEVMLFAGFISAFIIVRNSAPPGGWPPPAPPRLPVRSSAFYSAMLRGRGVGGVVG